MAVPQKFIGPPPIKVHLSVQDMVDAPGKYKDIKKGALSAPFEITQETLV